MVLDGMWKFSTEHEAQSLYRKFFRKKRVVSISGFLCQDMHPQSNGRIGTSVNDVLKEEPKVKHARYN